jgi:hypothetical protein
MVVKDDKIHRAKSVTHAGRMPGTRTLIEVLNPIHTTAFYSKLYFVDKGGSQYIEVEIHI